MDALPFDFVSPQLPIPVIEGRAGNRPLAIVVDLGAVGPYPLFLSDAAAAALRLDPSLPVTPERSTAVGSERASYRTATIPEFSIGPLTMRDARVSVTGVVDGLSTVAGRRIDAIVGYDLLKGRRVALDYVLKRIDFDALPGQFTDAVPIVTGPIRPITIVRASINGQGPFTVEIDTGASASSLSERAAKRAGIKPFGAGRMVGAGGAVAVRVGAARITVGNVTRDLPAVNVTDEIGRIGRESGVALDGVIGSDFLAGTRLTLDYPERRAWIEEAAPQK